jgi:hypothetical protein
MAESHGFEGHMAWAKAMIDREDEVHPAGSDDAI